MPEKRVESQQSVLHHLVVRMPVEAMAAELQVDHMLFVDLQGAHMR
jgi:hypothetical protein